MSRSTFKERRSELKAGVYLVEISDLFYLRNEVGELVRKDAFPIAIIQYKSKEGAIDQLYVIDKGKRQFYFDKALSDAKVPKETGNPFKKEDCIGKQLYIAIQEVWHVNNEHVIEENGEPVIEYQIFRTMPFNESVVPKLKGDPLLNNGIAQDKFKTYINKNTPFADEQPIFEV